MFFQLTTANTCHLEVYSAMHPYSLPQENLILQEEVSLLGPFRVSNLIGALVFSQVNTEMPLSQLDYVERKETSLANCPYQALGFVLGGVFS